MVPEREMCILQDRERSTVRAVCGVQLSGRDRTKDMMLKLGFNEVGYGKQCSLVW